MKDLIERLEKATGPSQSINEAIADLMNVPRFQWRGCPAYTSSIDAALRLVPENHRCTIYTEEITFDGETVKPSVLVVPYGEDYRWVDKACEGSTPAIALCIAAIKARASHNP